MNTPEQPKVDAAADSATQPGDASESVDVKDHGSEAPLEKGSVPKIPGGSVYTLDLNVEDSMLDANGRIDWLKAMSETGLVDRPATSPRKTARHPHPAHKPAETPEADTPDAAPKPPRHGHGKKHAPTPAPDEAEKTGPHAKTSTPPPEPGRAHTAPQIVAPLEGAAALDFTRIPGAEKVLRPAASSGAPPKVRKIGTPASAAPPAPEPPAALATPSPDKPEVLSRYEQLKRTPSMPMDPEVVQMANELSECMFHISRAAQKLGEFRTKYPFMIAPNVFGCWEDNLKECSTTMLREFQNLKEGRKKTYNKRYVCVKCKSVFFVSLPDGICDECRSKMTSH